MTGFVEDARAAAEAAPGTDDDALLRLIDAVRDAAARKAPLAIRGGGTKAWYGHRVDGAVLDVRGHAGIVDYEPSELVLVARAGTSLKSIEATLADQRQMLAFEPPRFDAGPPGASSMSSMSSMSSPAGGSPRASIGRAATIGGCVAAGLSGPRRVAAGAVRDFVLGARLIDGRGRHLAFGGRVMKNVAGYDVARALAGSLGTLGVLTEVALKVLPVPAQEVTVAFDCDEAAALDRMNRWAGQPIAITATAWHGAPGRPGRLAVRLEGSEAAVQSGIRRIGGIDVDPVDADALWTGLREQTDAFFSAPPPDVPLWRVALPPTTPPLDARTLAFDAQLVEWGGGLRWIATRADPAVVRAAAAAAGGHATLWRASEALRSRHGVFTPLSAPLMAIHRRLKAEFDPDRVFNRGRLYPDL